MSSPFAFLRRLRKASTPLQRESARRVVHRRPLLGVEELEPRVLLAAGLHQAPGLPGQNVAVQFTWLSAHADYRNEVGLFLVDDASGRVGSRMPGDPGYAAAALDPARRPAFFARRKSGGRRTVDLPGGTCFGIYLIRNATADRFLARNPDNRARNGPVAFFSFTQANPDGVVHVRARAGGFAIEDEWAGGDRDYNDFVGRIRFSTPRGTPPDGPRTVASVAPTNAVADEILTLHERDAFSASLTRTSPFRRNPRRCASPSTAPASTPTPSAGSRTPSRPLFSTPRACPSFTRSTQERTPTSTRRRDCRRRSLAVLAWTDRR